MNAPKHAGRLYCDNAATSYPKPPGVLEAVCDFLSRVGASAGRGAYREAIESGRVLERCRNAVRGLFGARTADTVIFTLNGTDALNLALKGALREGDHAVTTWMDHNSVLRPLSALESARSVRWTAVRADPHTSLVSVDDVAIALRRETRLVALNHVSNVTGAIQPLDAIAHLCRERGVLLLVDAAQSAGHLPIDLSKTPIDLLAAPGHKGLLGPLGTGLLVIRAGLENALTTFREGGTGSRSEEPIQPSDAPDKFEAGSHNAVGLAGLLAGLAWIEQRGVPALRAHEIELMERLMPRLDRCDGLRWFGPRDASQRVGVFSVRLDGLPPEELSTLLEQEFGILSRSGLHCAPFAHRTIGTHDSGGTTRLSLGPLHTLAHADQIAEALASLCRAAPAHA